jgi:hypothetical protein
VRPLLDAEKQKGGTVCVEVPDATTVALPGRKDRPQETFKFEYDRVYKMANPGRQMFAEVVQPLLGHFLQGFNTTVGPLSISPMPSSRACLPHLCP